MSLRLSHQVIFYFRRAVLRRIGQPATDNCSNPLPCATSPPPSFNMLLLWRRKLRMQYAKSVFFEEPKYARAQGKIVPRVKTRNELKHSFSPWASCSAPWTPLWPHRSTIVASVLSSFGYRRSFFHASATSCLIICLRYHVFISPQESSSGFSTVSKSGFGV